MKILLTISLLILFTSLVYAADRGVVIEPIPVIQNITPALKKSLDALRFRVRSDARDCLENAQGMESSGNYVALFRKTTDTAKIVVLEVSGSMVCDGAHSSSYRYGIALEKVTGKRVDLNLIYDIGIRQGGHLFLRPDLSDSVAVAYRLANASNRSCFDDDVGGKEKLLNFPLTFSPESDGSLALYYAAPDVSIACFPVLHLDASAVARYRNSEAALKYGLP